MFARRRHAIVTSSSPQAGDAPVMADEQRLRVADFNFVTKRLAVGAKINNSSDVDALAAAGITTVVDCCSECSDTGLLATRMAYLWDGTADDGLPKPDSWFQSAISFAMLAYVQPTHRIYFHCAAGVNRGPSMCYAFMRALGFPPAEAEALIRQARPQVGLRYKGDADRAVVDLGYA
jgi:hypothetical protein